MNYYVLCKNRDKLFMDVKYKELADKAFVLQKNGRLDEAEKIYNLLLELKHDDVNILNLTGMLYISQKKYEQAVSVLSKAVVLKPIPYIISNLAKAYYMNDEPDKSIRLYKQLEKSGEFNDDVFYSMALAYKKSGDNESAKEYYIKAVKINPNNFSAVYNLASLYKTLGENALAFETALKACKIKNNDEDVHSLLAGLYEEKNDYENSLKELLIASEINTKEVLYLYNTGVIYNKLKDKQNAIKYYKKVLEINPNHIQALINLSYQVSDYDIKESFEYIKKAYKINRYAINVNLALAQYYKRINKNIKSLNILKKIYEKAPGNTDVLQLMAMNYMDLCKYKKAFEYYDTALKIKPEDLSLLKGKAITYKYLGDIKSAKKILEYIVSQKNTNNLTLVSLGMIYLSEKNFEKGMELYIKRSNESKFSSIFKEKVWTKDTQIEGKSILLYSDCGLGDTIMFLRYIPELKKKAKEITLQTDKEITDIIKSNFKDIKVISKSQDRGNYDIVMSIMNLAYVLKTNFNHIPYSSGYLAADKELIDKYKSLKEFKTNKLRVGIFYQGNKNVFKNRSLPYRYVKKLAENDKIQLYSFQINDYEKEDNSVINLRDKISSFQDTAALLKCIDILVTVDSSIAHMAGALGVKTFLLLPYTAEWRWFNDNENTDWYDSVKIFRQDIDLKWNSVIKKVDKELTNYADKR